MADFVQTGPFSRKAAETVERLPGRFFQALGGLAQYLGSEKAARDYTGLLQGQIPNIGRSAAAGPIPLEGDPTGRYVPGFMQQSFKAPAAPILPPPGQGVTAIVRSDDDQYRQLLSQYGALQKAKKFEEADKLGMEIWNKKYGKTAMGQPKGAVGTYNPLLAKTFAGENIPSQVQAFTNPQGLNEQASFSLAANAVPAPWHTQGAAVSAPYQEAAAKAEEKTNPMNLVSQQGFDPDTLSRVSDFLFKFQK